MYPIKIQLSRYRSSSRSGDPFHVPVDARRPFGPGYCSRWLVSLLIPLPRKLPTTAAKIFAAHSSPLPYRLMPEALAAAACRGIALNPAARWMVMSGLSRDSKKQGRSCYFVSCWRYPAPLNTEIVDLVPPAMPSLPVWSAFSNATSHPCCVPSPVKRNMCCMFWFLRFASPVSNLYAYPANGPLTC